MKIYCVNLKRSHERRKAMEAQFAKYGLEHEFIEAVDGSQLTDEYVRKVYSLWRTRFRRGKGLSRGEIGCALSHIGIWKRVIADGEPVIVFEDDITFCDEIKDGLSKIVAYLATAREPALVKMSGWPGGNTETGEFIAENYLTGTYAYGLNAAAASLLLAAYTPIKGQIDHYCYMVRHFGLKLVSYDRTIVKLIADSESTIGEGRFGRPSRGMRLLFGVWRLLGKTIDRLLLPFEHCKIPVFVYPGGGDMRFSKSANVYQKRKLVAENLHGIFLAKKGTKTWPEFEPAMRTKLPRYVKPIYCDGPSNEVGFIKTILQRIFLWRRSVLFCWDPPGIFWRDRKDWLARFRCWVLNQLQSAAIMCSRVTIFNLHRGFAEANLWRCAVKRCEFFPNGVCLEERLRAVEGIAHVPHRLAINNAFMRGKGCFFVADVLSKLKQKIPGLSIAWVGADCGDREAVRDRLQVAGFDFAREVVHFGPAGFDESAKVLATASVALNAYPDVPSLRWNYVLKIPEFLAYGLRVVSADLPGSASYGTETFRAGDVDDAVAKLVAAFNSSSMPLETEKASKHLNLQTSKPLSLSSLSQWDWQAINHLIAEKVRKF